MQAGNTAFIKKDALKETGLELQYLTVIKDRQVTLNAYIVGNNCFHEVIFDCEEIYTNFKTVHGEVCLCRWLADEEGEYLQMSDSSLQRDFRKYSIIENILWVLFNVGFDDAGIDLICCDKPGVNLFLSSDLALHLLTNRKYGEIAVFPGLIDYDSRNIVSKELSS